LNFLESEPGKIDRLRISAERLTNECDEEGEELLHQQDQVADRLVLANMEALE